MVTTARQSSARKTPARKGAAARKPTRSAPSATAKTATTKSSAAATNPLKPQTHLAPPAAAASAKLPAKVEKPKKPKLVRDSFTIPKTEYAAIDALKQRATKIGKAPKKSELLRAGLMLMTQLSDEALNKALAAVPPIKTGRPKA